MPGKAVSLHMHTVPWQSLSEVHPSYEHAVATKGYGAGMKTHPQRAFVPVVQ